MVACQTPNADVDGGCRVKNLLPQPDWARLLDDAALDQLSTQGYVLISNVLDPDFFAALCTESQTLLDYQAAGLIDGVQQRQIRSDTTRWLNPTDAVGGQYLMALDQLSEWLNQQFYLGIRRAEAHYACYDAGQYYQLHRDNPKGSNVRAMSTVFYLNPIWQSAWGGQIRLQDRAGIWHAFDPTGNQMVVFESDLLHEVLPATTTRRSIAGWLRRDTATVSLV